MRLDSPYLGPEQLAEVAQLAGIRAAATVASDPDIEIEFPDGEGRITVYVVDPAAFACVERQRQVRWRVTWRRRGGRDADADVEERSCRILDDGVQLGLAFIRDEHG